jgi:polyribonucleotide nucleotidyltransferase
VQIVKGKVYAYMFKNRNGFYGRSAQDRNGRMAKQASGAVVSYGETVVLVTVTASHDA